MSTIKTLSSLNKADQMNILQSIELSELKMIVFPYKGNNETGVVYQSSTGSYLVVLDKFSKQLRNYKDFGDDDDFESDDDYFSDLDEDINSIEEEIE